MENQTPQNSGTQAPVATPQKLGQSTINPRPAPSVLEMPSFPVSMTEKDLPLLVQAISVLSHYNTKRVLEISQLKEKLKIQQAELQGLQKFKSDMIAWATKFSKDVNHSLYIIEQGLSASAEETISDNKSQSQAMLDTLKDEQAKLSQRMNFMEKVHSEDIRKYREANQRG